MGMGIKAEWGLAQEYVNRTISGVICYLTLVRGCLLFSSWFLKLKNLPISGGCILVNFVFLFKKQFLHHGFLTFFPVILIVFPLSFKVMVNAKMCVFPAIHQRLESDGTERVGGSMTQRLENILNSKWFCYSNLMQIINEKFSVVAGIYYQCRKLAVGLQKSQK